jgi:hypothetical protein
VVPQERTYLLRQGGITSLEIEWTLRPIDSCQVKDYIGIEQRSPKVLDSILFTENRDLIFLALRKVSRQVSAKEPPAAGD